MVGALAIVIEVALVVVVVGLVLVVVVIQVLSLVEWSMVGSYIKSTQVHCGRQAK